MIELKRLHTCSFQTAVEVWNRGFQGYAVDLTLTVDSLLSRMTSHGISPEYSFVAFFDAEPVGFLLNGIRSGVSRKFGWNGGTGVVPEMRGKGIGKKLVEAALELYVEQSVDVAMLEGLSNNESAITLYRRSGYEVFEELTFLQTDDEIKDFVTPLVSKLYIVRGVAPAAIGSLSFYRELSPWQCQWQSVVLSHGEGLIAYDNHGVAVGYALFKKTFTTEGKVARIGLSQCEVAPDRDDAEAIVLAMLQNVYSPELKGVRRTTNNLRKSNQVVVSLLVNAGFTAFIEQVHMLKEL